MADAAVTFLLENLSQHLKSNTDLISGAENELQQLQNELGLLKSFLQEAAKNPNKEEPFREMERQIREVVYDAEDTIDSCLAQVAAAKDRNFLIRGLNPKRVSLAKQVKSLREDKIKPVLYKTHMDFANMKIVDGSGTSVEEQWTKATKDQLVTPSDNVIGFKDQEDILINYLKEETEEFDVISIVGMPGLGKTTLAGRIFRNPMIEFEFPDRIWVCVSSEFRKKNVFLEILGRLTNLTPDMLCKTDEDLAQMVRSHLEGKKFLIVMDDVWLPKHWDEIQIAFPRTNRRSKILITTRILKVAWAANRRREPYLMPFLEPEECWKLLQFKVFGEALCPPKLEVVGKKIARICSGLPLAVVVIGGILSEERETNTWEKVLESTNSFNLHRVISDYMEGLLSLSYNSLPNLLRPCFLYMGMFPEDFEIPIWKLTRLWIAEGFIEPKPGISLEEVAEDNLDDLIRRNLVMIDKVSPDGKVKTCRVHDVLLEFCKDKARQEENFFQEIIIRSGKGIFVPPISDLQNHRRLCIHSNVLDFFTSEPYVPLAHSFLCFSKDELFLLPEYISLVTKAFKRLRVLEINFIKFTRFPLDLTKLVHLRYISLSGNFRVLPEDVSKLRNAQTLIIDTESRTLVIKADIWKMIQLRHIKTNASIILRKTPKNNEGRNLQTLTKLSPESCTNDVFDKACYLKKLGIRGRLATLLDGEVGSRKFDSLGKLRELENLKLLNDVYPSPPSEGRLACLPLSHELLPRLRSLTLSDTFLNWENMSVLGMLENLEVLKLKDNAFVGESWEVVDGGFRSLEFLKIGYTNLVFWKASGDHFPRLRCLMVGNCEELEALPQGLATVLSLQVIDLHRPSRTAAASARKIQQERLQMEGNSRSREFKLSIYPPDE